MSITETSNTAGIVESQGQIHSLATEALDVAYRDLPKAVELAKKGLTIRRRNGQQNRRYVFWYIIGLDSRTKHEHQAATHWLKKAHKYAVQNNDWQIAATSLRELAAAFVQMGVMPKAIKAVKSAMQYDCDTTERLRILSLFAQILTQAGLYEKSAQVSRDVIQQATQAKALHPQASAHFALGVVLFVMHDFEEALVHYNLALEILQSLGNATGIVEVCSNICRCHAQLRQPNRADPYIEIMNAYKEKYNPPKMQVEMQSILAAQALQREDIDAGFQHLTAALDISRTTEDPAGILNACLELGWLYLQEQQADQALPHFLEAASIANRETGITKPVVIDLFLSESYEALGRHDLALQHNKAHHKLRDEYLGQAIRKRINVILTEHKWQIERLEHAMARQNAETMAKELQRQNRELINFALSLQQKSAALEDIQQDLLKRREEARGRERSFLSGLIRKVRGHLDNAEQWQHFEQQFNLINDTFLRRLAETCPELSAVELKVCVLLKLYLSTQDISALLNISDKTVYTHRQNIRRKLALSRGQKLVALLQRV